MSEPSPVRTWSPGDGVSRVLVVSAHPDDVDFGAAGTVAAMRDAGVEVAYCIVTDGDAGGSDRTVSRAAMAAIRREEQRAAAAAVGVVDVTFLGYPDGRLECTSGLRRDLTRVVRRFRPQRVLAPSPERCWDHLARSHPDHLAAGEAAVCVVYPDARNPFAHPELLEAEGLEPHTVDELWLMAAPSSDLAVDVSATFGRKMAAIGSHRSQIADLADLERRLRDGLAAAAAEAGLPPGSLAETFRSVPTA